MLNSSFPKYAENQHLGCVTVEKIAEEKDSSDSFDAASLESSDSSDHEEFDVNKLRRGKNRKKQKPIFPTFNPNTPMELIDFQPGLIFTSRQLLRDAIRNYGVAKQRRVFIKRSDFKRLAAKSSTIADFNICMDEIRSISPFAYDDLLKTNPKYWSRAYFKTMTHCDVVDNNISECFNSWILEARYKPIISMLDHIRVQCMKRIHVKRDYMARIDSDLCPRIIKKLNYNIEGSKKCTSTWDGGDKCEVKDLEGNQFEVDMKNRICSCRKWQLTGMPCIHGCQAILSINAAPESFVDEYFKKTTYLKSYSYLMSPMKGSKEWPLAKQVKLLPPKARRMPGRPRKHRRREANEVGGGYRLSKKRLQGLNHQQVLDKQKKRGRPPKTKQINQQHPTPTSSPQAPSIQEVPTEAAQKKRRGRPPKTSNTKVQTRKMPAGMGVFTGDDGHTYMSSSRSTIRLTDSEPNTTTQDAEQVSRQPSKSPLKKGGQMVFPRSEPKK
ncbi:hypothetical protein POM88_033393 [Heracleum sosnowskyi]|uniref:SWIM-type domain-containing protein n=1 Tax=Heracleum sosnowskyi TaxID=360622 RepID=A0AAD8I470_9APIA|nr:hypothetical protein POM88_033393 [Heracleum sosnowskyi]